MKTLLIGLIGLVAFNLSPAQIAVKTQVPGLVTLAAIPLSTVVDRQKPVPPFLFLELEKGFGEKNSVLVYGAIRKGRNEYPSTRWGPNYLDASGYKLGMAYRRYLGASDPMEGFYLQPTVQFWQGKLRVSSGDIGYDSDRTGGSFTVHGGYQLVIGSGLVVDGSAGLGFGTEKVEADVIDRISGYHRLRIPTGGLGWAVDVRLGIGWMF